MIEALANNGNLVDMTIIEEAINLLFIYQLAYISSLLIVLRI